MRYIKNLVYFLAITSVVFYACNKNNNDTPAPLVTARLVLINTIADTTRAVNFYSYGTRQNGNSIGYRGITPSIYVNTQLSVNVKQNGSSDNLNTNAANILLKDSTTNYLFLTGKYVKDSVSYFVVLDTMKFNYTTNSSSKAIIRFVNVTQGVGPVNYTINNLILPKIGYKSASAYSPADTGLVILKVNQSSTGSLVYTTPIQLMPSVTYTFYSYGVLNNANVPVGVKLLVNR